MQDKVKSQLSLNPEEMAVILYDYCDRHNSSFDYCDCVFRTILNTPRSDYCNKVKFEDGRPDGYALFVELSGAGAISVKEP